MRINPVVGTILMIVFTIILAGVIALLIFRFSGDIAIPQLSNLPTYSKTVTIQIETDKGFIDTEGNGYITTNSGVYLRDNTYNITYYIDSTTYERRVLTGELNKEITQNPYRCINVGGVCK